MGGGGGWYVFKERKTAGTAKETLLLQFRDAITSVAATLQAGYSMENAWREAKEMNGTIWTGMGYLSENCIRSIRRLEWNQSIEKLLYEFALRSDCEDIQRIFPMFCSLETQWR